MEKLSPRQKAVLLAIVQEYVATAVPVSSKTVLERIGLGLSSATIRNEMAQLEAAGYLDQPHTSAGRVPTGKGYRYFVQQLMEESALSSMERRKIRHQFSQVKEELDQYMRLAASILATTVRSASLVAAPIASPSRFLHLELISVHEQFVLMILVLQGGIVKQRLLLPGEPLSQDELSKLANRLNDLLAGMTMLEIQARGRLESPIEALVLENAMDMMEREDQRAQIQIYRDGLANVLHEPEFRETGVARSLVEAFEENTLWDAIFSELPPAEGVHVIIGGEGQWEQINQCSIVLSHYGSRGGVSGTLGVLGPMRMSYPRAISAVRYVAALMGDIMNGNLAHQGAEI